MVDSENRIVLADNLAVLPEVADASVDLVYIDPPFNTGKTQRRTRTRAVRDASGGHTGFHGARYRKVELGESRYTDRFDDFQAFLRPRLEHAHRILAPHGSFFLHIDYREAHYCKVALDEVFGRASFLNEIVWAYDYGARSKKRWSSKHDTIFWYAKDPKRYTFDFEAMDRIPYMAPGLVTPEKAARGKTPTDVWWHTIVSPTGRERTGYATQKPLGVLERIVKVHSRPGDLVVDFFAGSGTTGEAAAAHDRRFLLVDSNPDAVRIMAKRLARFRPALVGCEDVSLTTDAAQTDEASGY
ncbi:MAG: site-specific DNA-methyltransferase [Planctomycetes bacterium]|nr:site-specific DNA-methyltransferase [Planctomycetota bacterium]